MTIIPQKQAMVCIRTECAVIWEGPARNCPKCGHEGVPYKDIEDMAIGPELPDMPQMLTTMIQ